MRVVERTPRIDVTVEGRGLDAFIGIIKKSIPDVQIVADADADEPQDIDEWDYYRAMRARLTPASVLKIRRENAGLTQAALAEKCGIAATNIALMETGKRSIGIRSARKLADALGCDAGDFVVWIHGAASGTPNADGTDAGGAGAVGLRGSGKEILTAS